MAFHGILKGVIDIRLCGNSAKTAFGFKKKFKVCPSLEESRGTKKKLMRDDKSSNTQEPGYIIILITLSRLLLIG